MRRALARGRVFPQGYSTDRRYGRLSIKAVALFPLMWANADDQGRLCGDPDEVKYTCCPNIDDITKAEIPGLLKELQTNKLILCYNTPQSAAIQMLDWWDPILGQRPQWAYPSQYPPPEGWTDRLRYHPTPTEVITENWVPAGQFDRALPSALPKELPSALPSALPSNDSPLPQTPSKKRKRKDERGKMEDGRGRLPSALGKELGSPSPSPAGDHINNFSDIFDELVHDFRYRWGRVPASDPYSVIPREPEPKEEAQMRDLAKELSSAGGLPRHYVSKAFDEASSHQKHHISYVRGVILDWLGIERDHSQGG